jgi:hypothetical protein
MRLALLSQKLKAFGVWYCMVRDVSQYHQILLFKETGVLQEGVL